MYNLLLVDDEAIMRMGMKTCIDWKKHGIVNIYEAESGLEALDILRKHPIAIMISDIRMAGMDGIELMQSLDQFSKKPKVIIMSCYNDFETMRSIMRLGALDFLFKPKMYPDDIELVIQNVLMQIKKEANEKDVTTTVWDEDLNRLNLENYQEAVQSLLRELEFKKDMTLASAKNLAVSLIVRMIDIFKDSHISQSLFKGLVSLQQCVDVEEVSRLIEKLTPNTNLERNDVGRDKILEAINYIEQNLTSPNLNMELVAKHVSLSPSYFSRLFKNVIGCSYTQFVTDKRIELAEYLYHTTNLKIYEIAERVGYTSARYFSKLYKQQRGKSIGERA